MECTGRDPGDKQKAKTQEEKGGQVKSIVLSIATAQLLLYCSAQLRSAQVSSGQVSSAQVFAHLDLSSGFAHLDFRVRAREKKREGQGTWWVVCQLSSGQLRSAQVSSGQLRSAQVRPSR